MTTRIQPELTVVVPAFNEERRLGATMDRVALYLSQGSLSWELLIVDDGSTDGSAALAESASAAEPRVRLLRVGRNRGKGNAVRAGFQDARGELVLFSDADLSTPIEELERLRAALAAGAHVAIGSRALPDSDVRVRQNILRQTMGKTFNLIVRLATGLSIHDTQCGFKLFRREPCARVFAAQRLEGFAFDVELLFLAQRCGLKVAEVPVAWINSPDSRVHVVRDSLRMLRDVLRIRLNAMLGRYRIAAATPPA